MEAQKQLENLKNIIVDHYEDIQRFDCQKYPDYSRTDESTSQLQREVLMDSKANFKMFDFTKKTHKIVTSSTDNKIRVYDTKTFNLMKELDNPLKDIVWIGYTKYDRWILIHGSDSVAVLNSATYEIQITSQENSPVVSACLCPNNKYLGYVLASSEVKSLDFWNKTHLPSITGIHSFLMNFQTI